MTTQCKVVKINDVCPNCHFSMPHAENEVAVPPPNVRDHKNDTENSSTQGNDSVEKIRKLSHDRVEGTRAEIMASEQQVEKIAEDMDKERPPNADTTTPNNTPPTASDDAQNRQIITSKDGPDTSGTGKIPDAALAETRNRNNSRELVNNLDDVKEAVAFGEDEVEPWVVVCAEPDLEVVETDQQRTLWQRFF
ncbi:hypothetical protein B0O99DRAFT_686671 [Bisporella sp. PMI_857]|nr:hypothetical protein B0O99DRAFT_686671 [Bisporella sp. PMI_857]